MPPYPMPTYDRPRDPAFVTGPRRDRNAVTADLIAQESFGPVESHTKALKRQIHQRATPDPLCRHALLRSMIKKGTSQNPGRNRISPVADKQHRMVMFPCRNDVY